MLRLLTLVLAGALAMAVLAPVSPATAAPPSKAQCEKAWYEWQYSSLAPGFPATLPPKERNRLVKECRKAGRLPDYDTQSRLTQRAFNTTARILELKLARVSRAKGVLPCEAALAVLKPVGPKGTPLGPGGNVEGYASDSFLPVLKYNWRNGPFRLKWNCNTPIMNLWFFVDTGGSYLDDDHPDRYPTDAEVDKDPWPRDPVHGAMSVCLSWGPGLKNSDVGGRAFMFGFSWNRKNLPNLVDSCYPRALGLEGLGRYPFEVVPNLPL